jgi:DNA-binding response OmpR family regulator
MKLLLIEDDAMIADAIGRYFVTTSGSIEVVSNLTDAEVAMAGFIYDCVILDLTLPDGDGLVFLRNLRNTGSDIPVLILTARDKTAERILGLNDGADDYLPKPFDLGELHARVSAIVRRRTGRTKSELVYGPLRLLPDECAVWFKDAPVAIPISQFRLLHHLLVADGRLQTKQQLVNALYAWDDAVADNTIEVYVSQLRKTLWPRLIRTVRGVGYCIPADPALP